MFSGRVKKISAALCAATLLVSEQAIAHSYTVDESFTPEQTIEQTIPSASSAQAETSIPTPDTKPQQPSAPDKKHSLYGDEKNPTYRVEYDFSGGSGSGQGVFGSVNTQRERVGFLAYHESPTETNTAGGVRLFPWGDPFEIKLAGQFIQPPQGPTTRRGLAEITFREFLKPPHGRYLKVRGGIEFESDKDGTTTEGYLYLRHGLNHRVQLLGTTALVSTQPHNGATTTDINWNGGGILNLPHNQYVTGGLAHESGHPLTAVFGVSKAADDHSTNTFAHLAYLADFRMSQETKFALFGLTYGLHNQLVREPITGIAESMHYGAILNPNLSQLRRFDAIENGTTLDDIARLAVFGVGLKKDLGGGMTLTTWDVAGTYNLFEQDEGHTALFVGNEIGRTKITGIPHAGTIKETVHSPSFGVRWPIGGMYLRAAGTAHLQNGEKPNYDATTWVEWSGKH